MAASRYWLRYLPVVPSVGIQVEIPSTRGLSPWNTMQGRKARCSPLRRPRFRCHYRSLTHTAGSVHRYGGHQHSALVKAWKQRAATAARRKGGVGFRTRQPMSLAAFQQGRQRPEPPHRQGHQPTWPCAGNTASGRRSGWNAASGRLAARRNVAPASPWTALVPRVWNQLMLAGNQQDGSREGRRQNLSLRLFPAPRPAAEAESRRGTGRPSWFAAIGLLSC
jgi:hypothetical protein